ncbi:MAG: hypothetical protein QS721_14595 [Candidatus Endonucleobacter sp. (ex Gigantidas childressi)]|nr:hypothetical protein [Candidatus Endonucleobacter sp. (ex Gigantidas childressi)]
MNKHKQIHSDAMSFKCKQCTHIFKTRTYLTKHEQRHNIATQHPKKYTCNECTYQSNYDRHLKQHTKKYHTIVANKNDIQIIKEEPAHDIDILDSRHYIDNQTALWTAEPLIKKEYIEIKKKKKPHTYFAELELSKNDPETKLIRKAISSYKGLADKEREEYLNERMSVRKHDGSTFIELKDQKEVFAVRGLARLEILGHYAGKQYTEASYNNPENSMMATRTNIDSYSVTTTDERFISGYRSGNVTSLINACTTYSESDKGRALPEKNVSFIRHKDNQGIYIVFLIALKDIEAGATLWTDYGKEYWEAKCCAIEISDSEDDAK